MIASLSATTRAATVLYFLSFQYLFNVGEAQQTPFPGFRYVAWENLSGSVQDNADILGYNKKKWDKPGKAKIEEGSFDNLKGDEQAAARAIGFTAESWNCWINHYYDFKWADLQNKQVSQYFEVFGWTRKSWEDEDEPMSWDKDWYELNDAEITAATQICYFEEIWNGEKIRNDWTAMDITTMETNPPTKVPSREATEVPSREPTEVPTNMPMYNPSNTPTSDPSTNPTLTVSMSPTISSASSTSSNGIDDSTPQAASNHEWSSSSDSRSDIEYFTTPKISWKTILTDATIKEEAKANIDHDNDRSQFKIPPTILGHGNGLTLSDDNKYLYITRNNGELEVLNAINGEHIWRYTPQQRSNDRNILCKSKVYFGENEDIGQFLVYAIIDQAPGDTDLDSQSRIVAVSIPDHSHLWTSPPISGVVVGTPIVTRGFLSGQYIFIVYNTGIDSSADTPEGHFSILVTANGGTELFTESAGFASSNDRLPYGPLSVSHFPTRGKYDLGVRNKNDVVVWTTSAKDGMGGSGYLRAFQIPAGFDASGDDLFTVRLKSVSWNAIARPTLSDDGLKLFVGVRQSELRGWVRDRSFADAATWQQKLDEHELETKRPIQSAGVLSKDEKRLFVLSSGKTFNAIDTETGGILWKHETTSSAALTEAFTSPKDDQRVYYVDSSTGTVYSFDQESGDLNWNFNGTFRPVEAQWCISDNGLFLYYGDTSGKVQALALGMFSDSNAVVPSPSMIESSDDSDETLNQRPTNGDFSILESSSASIIHFTKKQVFVMSILAGWSTAATAFYF